ncbi:sortase family protein [mine drainage metagenome]|uniref:Sortase family protein n=1 Tax=mine drainage metagenome TaxID=410659 RepID=A0A1J5QD53_9ZZZZ
MLVLVGLVAGACSAPSAARPTAPVGVSVAPAPSSVPSVPPSPAASSAPAAAAHLSRSVPVRLQIPAIGVDSTLMPLGLNADGTMQVPPSGFPAGWYTGAPTPGELGPAIIAGHVDWNGPGVFYELRRVVPGDTISVTRADTRVVVFRVTRVAQYPKVAFPTSLVYGNVDYAGLRLITCGGSWDAQAHHYVDDTVVFAELVSPS